MIEQSNREKARVQPDDPPQNPDELVNQFMHLPPVVTLDVWGVLQDGQMVAQGLMQCLSIGSNEDQAQLTSLLVDPEWRRQGVGTELMRQMAGRALQLGRTTLMTNSTSLEAAGALFLAACGLEARQENGENRLHLADLSPALLRDCTTRPDDDYTLEIWLGNLPEGQLEA